MLKERILILNEANVISDVVANYVNDVIDSDLNFAKDKENVLEMLTTHLAMATQRILSNQEVEQLDDTIWEEVTNHKGFDKAQVLYERMANHAPCKYPEGEKRFLLMHLCNLYQ